MTRTPDFLIIGAQKCGTSWLHHQLRQADAIYMPADKDFEHFSYVGNLNAAAFVSYCERFHEARVDQRAGDANAAYFWTRTGSRWGRQPDSFNPEIPFSIRRFCGPGLKLIVMLRHPVERAVSAYLHHIRHGAVTPAVSILDPELPLGIVDMGFYRTHLANWRRAYPREQLHLINGLPTSRDAAVEAVESTCAFLEVTPPPLDRYYFEPVFPGLSRVIDDAGVWIPETAEIPAAARRDLPAAGPARLIDGRPHRRVVTDAELRELHAILDAHAFDEWDEWARVGSNQRNLWIISGKTK